MKDLDYYIRPSIKYPSKEDIDQIKEKYAFNPEFVGTLSQIEIEQERCKNEIKRQIQILKDDYKLSKNLLMEEFKNDLLKEYDLFDHPKRDLLYSLAWEYGHSDGLRNVIDYFDELSELVTR